MPQLSPLSWVPAPLKLTASNNFRRAVNSFRTISTDLSSVQMLEAKSITLSIVSLRLQTTETLARRYTLRPAPSDLASPVLLPLLTNTMLRPLRMLNWRLSMLSASSISSDTLTQPAPWQSSKKSLMAKQWTTPFSSANSRESNLVFMR